MFQNLKIDYQKEDKLWKRKENQNYLWQEDLHIMVNLLKKLMYGKVKYQYKNKILKKNQENLIILKFLL